MAIDPIIIQKIKTNNRFSHNVLDGEVEDTITACLADLRVCGVKFPAPTDPQDVMDPLILNAVKLYCKAAFTDDVGKSAEYSARYDALKSSLMMAEGYKEAPGDE